MIDQHVQHHHGDHGNQDDDELNMGDLNEILFGPHPDHAGIQRRQGLILGALGQLHVILQHQRHPDGRNQRGQPRGSTQGAIGDALHRISVKPGDGDGEYQRDQQRHRQRRDPECGRQGQEDGEQVRGDHVDLPVGKVDHADDAVDHRVADGDQPVDRAQNQPVNQLLNEDVHVGLGGCSVNTGKPRAACR